MAKTLLSIQDLQAQALAEIRKQPGCSNVQGIAINRVSDQHADSNWSLCVLSAGAADANTAARAALHVQSVLRRDYDLMTDWPHGTAEEWYKLFQCLPARRVTVTGTTTNMTMIDQLTEHDRIELLARAQEAWDRAPQNTMRAVFEWRGKNYVVSHSSVHLRVHTEEGIKVYWNGMSTGLEKRRGLCWPVSSCATA
jgi:hypothetical protein